MANSAPPASPPPHYRVVKPYSLEPLLPAKGHSPLEQSHLNISEGCSLRSLYCGRWAGPKDGAPGNEGPY